MNDQNEFQPVRQPDQVSGEAAGGFVNSLVDIFVDPTKVFNRIGAGLVWWKPFIITAVITVILGWVMMPIHRHLLILNERGMSEEQLEMALEKMNQFGLIGLVFGIILILVLMLVFAGITHLIVSIMSSESSYTKMLSLGAWCGLIPLVGQIIMSVILRMKGVEAIESSADMEVNLSLSAFFPELEGIGKALLDSIGLFEIWYYILFITGISIVFRISRQKALFPAIVVWAISVLLLMLRGMFGGGMG